ncbi:SDR family NAD(P)-dependent oxidoreductase [Nocardiopsis aegyptia]|uniref:NAD(P)-dependent dehydrogenase (Short-subunit alcohol dehydrogenase family) n=1 Tax=Nocardiopsis aegyptia TaxID=220378 RepID=A0A7Z0JBA6_9ACTN|nr:SDR family NAD(P)-dependent oxidoreductase [Nocardiopsis aegyptia]NYJ36031.1 NAD(P)-dependent dehydrogenase (short-subunit alcohol dehydrogenase family) [Nocardiopsis aegyptia]
MDINNAVVLVTGSNRGLGLALVDAFLEHGARRVHAATRGTGSPSPASRSVRGEVVPLRLDLTSPDGIRAAAAQASDVTLLVNNAGTARFADPFSADRDGLAQEMATNYAGTVDVIRAFVPVIERAGGGAVVNVLSLLALAGTPPMAGYSASKAALHSFTQAIRPGLRPRGIEVHGVYPGGIDTDMLAGFDAAKAEPRAVADAIVGGVSAGHTDIFPDATSEEMSALGWSDPKGFERAFSGQ